jgi:membrane protein YqaA with SNARE-associated domain
MRKSFRTSLSAMALLQSAKARNSHSITSKFRHLGAFGLFFLAILDSSPIPTLGGPDILTAILAASHRNPWYEYTAVATAGSVIGAYITFRLARKAGEAYLQTHFTRKARGMLDFFHRWGTSALAVSTAVPFPFPTSMFFAAAGATRYDTRKFVGVVLVCRAVRYTAIGIVADYYGRHFVRVLRHPGEYWVSLSLLALCVFGLSVIAILLSRHKPATEESPSALHDRELARQARNS